jgi:tRNA (cmo5U34)-methyltransferase
MRDVVATFQSIAAHYDEPRRRLVPCFDAFYGTAVAVAASALGGRPNPEVLDLGAGTGLLSAGLAAARPDARFTLVDAAPAMLDVAAQRLTAAGAAHRVLVADLADPLPPGRFDAVVSALAIHHLGDEHKRELYARIRHALLRAPDPESTPGSEPEPGSGALPGGGVFVNAEQVAGPTPALDRRYHEVWMAETTALGASDQELAAAAARMAYDRPATVEDQCAWLRTLGYRDVDCFFKSWRFAVFGGYAR